MPLLGPGCCACWLTPLSAAGLKICCGRGREIERDTIWGIIEQAMNKIVQIFYFLQMFRK